jgi:hypothetical protein
MDKISRGIESIYPSTRKALKQRRLHTKSQPLEQLDEVIEKIRKMMFRSVEAVSQGNMSRGELAIA